MSPRARVNHRDTRRRRLRRELAMEAVRLFDEKGFAATTVEEIAETAAYSARTFYRQFPRKEDAVFYDLPEMFESLHARLNEASAGGAWEIVKGAVLQFAVEWDSVDPAFFDARNRLLDRESVLQVRYRELSMEWQDLIAEILAAERGVDPATDLYCRVAAGAILMSDLEAMRLQRLQGGPLAAYVEAGFSLLETGFGEVRRVARGSGRQARGRPA